MNRLTSEERADDARRGYELGVACWRESCIRKRQIAPRPGDAREQRWAEEGSVLSSQFDTVREAVA